jgi:hypothetical protein
MTVACRRAVSLFFFLLLVVPLSAFAEESTVLYACVVVGNGNMRLVAEDVPCRSTETRVSWNVTGPPGAPGADGEDGEDAGGGPPYLWACGPLNYGNASNTAAVLHVFNGGASTANVAVHFLNKDGVNLAGVNVPLASPPPPGDPLPTFPGQTGATTVPLAASHTMVLPWLSAFGVAANGGDMPATIRVISDQPVAVGAHIAFSGWSVVPCSLVHR